MAKEMSGGKISRRDTLKILGGGGLAALSPGLRVPDKSSAQTALRVDVVVAGAGFAGMTAARKLLREGKKVAVLEARDRVGGRIKAGSIAGQSVDAGGMWVGPTQTRILDLIKEFGLHTTPQYITGKNVEQVPGKRWLGEGEDFGFEDEDKKEFEAISAQLDRLSSQVPVEAPWSAPRAEEFDAMTVEEWLGANVKRAGIRNVLRANIRSLCEAEPFQMSFLFLLFYIRSGDNLETLFGVKNAAQAFRVVEGMHRVAGKLAEELGPAVVLSTPVRAISQTSTTVTVRCDRGSWTADYCVVAVPLPLSVRIAFDPPLPPERDALAQRMPMGSVIKWYAAYAKPFWREHGWNGYANSALRPINVCYDATPAGGTPGLLVGFIDGQSALRWTSRSMEDRRKLVLERLVDFFGPEAGEVIDYEDQNWPAEEWSRGCYGASMGPGVMTSIAQFLRRPHGRIYWAGTETSSEWMGYVDGAIRSGERAAAEITQALAGRGVQSTG